MAKQRFRDLKHGKVNTQKPEKPVSSTPKGPRFPNKRTRFKAAITDSFMLVMPIMYLVFYLVMGGREGFAANMLLGWAYILVPLIFIQIVFLAKSSQTPGMRAYNIKVVDAATLSSPTFGQIVVRQLLTLLSLFTFGWMLMFFRRDYRTLHELLSRTTLVVTDNPRQQRSVS
jgi:uncharacterized RDD family membrane protein YckC